MTTTTNKLLLYLQLFWVFFKIGPSTFGGGYAMIPVLEKELVDNQKWISREEMNNLMSLAGSAPGGVGVNASAFLGYRLLKIPGAIIATLAITLPTVIIVLSLSFFYAFFHDEPKVQAAFRGIQGAIIGLIAVAAYKMGKTALFDATTYIIAAVAIITLLTTGLNPSFMILIGLLLGISIIYIKQKLGLPITTEKKMPENSRAIEYYI